MRTETRDGACRKRSAPQPTATDHAHLVAVIARKLEREFGGLAPTAALVAVAQEAVDDFADAAVSNFVPILAQRRATETAKALLFGHAAVAS
ncbi:MAG: three-helix bundle dimerization domain-containing protein [Acidimicrobiales bacterium]